MRFAALLILSALAACAPNIEYSTATAPFREPPREPSTDITAAIDWGDVERHSGRQVAFDGLFNHIQGQHGVVTLDSGLRIFLPHFDLYKRDEAWFEYVGRRVRAGGLLHTYTRDIPGYQGPSIEVNRFQVLE